METSKNDDWERRRTKPRKARWAKWLMRPQTLTILVSVGRVMTFLVWLYHLVTGWIRE
jgi:nitrate reductase NapE component